VATNNSINSTNPKKELNRIEVLEGLVFKSLE
jgi:hypothetical protein